MNNDIFAPLKPIRIFQDSLLVLIIKVKEMQEQVPEKKENQLELADRDQIITFDNTKRTSVLPKLCGQSSHPITAMVHICYKVFLVFLYLTLPLTTSTQNFIAIIILAAAVDFWITKNIVGRKLVGMRWWVQFTEDGEQNWRFESRVDERFLSSGNETVFWWTFYIFIIVWGVLSVINTIGMKFPHIFVCLFCLTVLQQNLSCYSKCYKIKGENMSRLMQQHGPAVINRFMRGSIVTNMQ